MEVGAIVTLTRLTVSDYDAGDNDGQLHCRTHGFFHMSSDFTDSSFVVASRAELRLLW